MRFILDFLSPGMKYKRKFGQFSGSPIFFCFSSSRFREHLYRFVDIMDGNEVISIVSVIARSGPFPEIEDEK